MKTFIQIILILVTTTYSIAQQQDWSVHFGGEDYEAPINIKDVGLTEFAQAMTHYPDCMVKGDAVQAYRNYYHQAKSFAKWEWGREAPTWWKGYSGAEVHSETA